MSQRRRLNVLSFPNSPHSANASRLSKLPSGKLTMLRSTLSRSQPFGSKAEELKRRRPDEAAVVEKLVDDLLAEV